MPVEIRRGRSSRFGYKAGAIIILLFLIVALVYRFVKEEVGNFELGISNEDANNLSVICFDINSAFKEREWSRLLAGKLDGKLEVSYNGGRVDILTEDMAIEVDFFKKWKEGIGQALAYGDHFDRAPALALIDDGSVSIEKEQIEAVTSLATEHGIHVFLLRSYHEDDC